MEYSPIQPAEWDKQLPHIQVDFEDSSNWSIVISVFVIPESDKTVNPDTFEQNNLMKIISILAVAHATQGQRERENAKIGK